VRRDGPRSLESAWGIDSQKPEVVADVGVSGLACWTGSTGIQWADDNPVANLPAGDAVAKLGDLARHLVPDHLGYGHSLVHVALIDVQVCAAHAAVGDVDSHLAWAWGLWNGLSELYSLAPAIVSCFHLDLLGRL
jgi:hypothetical protein